MRCTRGAIFDVAVDLRPDSPTYLRWFGAELSADDGLALYVPDGLRARLPDARGRQRGALPDRHALRARRRRAACAGTTRRSAIEWPAPPRGGTDHVARATPSTPTSRREPASCSPGPPASSAATCGALVAAGPRGARGHDRARAPGGGGVTWHQRRSARGRRRRRRSRARGARAPRLVRRARAVLDRAGERALGRGVAALLRAFAAAGGGGRCSPARAPSTTGRRWASAARSTRRRCGRRPSTAPPSTRCTPSRRRYAEQAGFELAWGRIFFVYGPGEPDGRLVPVGRRGRCWPASRCRRRAASRSATSCTSTTSAAAFAALGRGQRDRPGERRLRASRWRCARWSSGSPRSPAGPELPRPGALPERDGDPPRLVADVAPPARRGRLRRRTSGSTRV